MEINLKSSEEAKYRMYIEILNPILNLKTREKELLTALLKVHMDNIKYGEEYVAKIMIKTSTRKEIREKVKFSEPSYNNHLKQLRDKNIIKNSMILPLIVKNAPKENEFNINYNIVIDGIRQENKEDNKKSLAGT